MNKKKSFTLVEMLVVIAIIGILSGVILISTSGSTDKARLAKAQAFATTTQTQLGYDLISEWKFEGHTGIGSPSTNIDVLDSVGSNDGDITGHAPTIKGESDCISGKCLFFDGLDDYIDFGNKASLDLIDKNIEFWFKTSVNGVGVIGQTGGSGQWVLTIRGNRFVWDTWATGLDMAAYKNIIDDKWHHFVVSISDSKDAEYFYLDGVLERVSTATVTTPAATGNLYLGSCSVAISTTWCTNAGATASFFNGYLDEVKIYKEALGEAKIKEQYLAGLDSMLAKNLISKEEYNEKVELLAKN